MLLAGRIRRHEERNVPDALVGNAVDLREPEIPPHGLVRHGVDGFGQIDHLAIVRYLERALPFAGHLVESVSLRARGFAYRVCAYRKAVG